MSCAIRINLFKSAVPELSSIQGSSFTIRLQLKKKGGPQTWSELGKVQLDDGESVMGAPCNDLDEPSPLSDSTPVTEPPEMVPKAFGKMETTELPAFQLTPAIQSSFDRSRHELVDFILSKNPICGLLNPGIVGL